MANNKLLNFVSAFIILNLSTASFAINPAYSEAYNIQTVSADNVASNSFPCVEEKGGPNIDVSIPVPPMLLGIKKVLVFADISGYQDLKISRIDVQNETICQYESYFKLKNKNIKVDALNFKETFFRSEGMLDPNNLFVLVELVNRSEKLNGKYIALSTFQMKFFRNVENHVEDLTLQCARSFIAESSDRFYSDLIDAIRSCIPMKF